MVIKTDGKAIFAVFIGALIAVVFIGIIATSVVGQTETRTIDSTTFTSAAVNETTELTGRNVLAVTAMANSSGDLICCGNITLGQGTGADGMLTVLATTTDVGTIYAEDTIVINYTYIPDGYLNSSGARSVSKLIVILAALAIVIFVIVVWWKEGSLGKLINQR